MTHNDQYITHMTHNELSPLSRNDLLLSHSVNEHHHGGQICGVCDKNMKPRTPSIPPAYHVRTTFISKNVQDSFFTRQRN